jgi:hypothetical protein
MGSIFAESGAERRLFLMKWGFVKPKVGALHSKHLHFKTHLFANFPFCELGGDSSSCHLKPEPSGHCSVQVFLWPMC